MYRNKKDVDKHVENLLSKLSLKEFKTRAYSVARLYFEVGDFANCQKYVEEYISQKGNNAAAYKLLAQALQKLGQKEKALEQYKMSLDIDPTQTSVILDICELLADEDVTIDPGRAKYWCEKAEATFPRHPVTFRLSERLVTISNPDPEAILNLLKAELVVKPKDVMLHIRLLKSYFHTNKFREAFEHSCNIELIDNTFVNNFAWYEVLVELLKNDVHNTNDWLYQLFLLTVRERICVLSLTEIPASLSKSLIESNELLHIYDQAIENVAKAGPCAGFAEFHAGLLHHHRGQFAFHAATFLLKKAKKSQMNWRDAVKLAAPLMLIAWHTTPVDPKANWLRHAPEKQVKAVNRWYYEGNYRCSQSGHYLLTNIQDKSQSFIDQITQCCSGTHWRDKIYEKVFPSRNHLTKIKTSHFVSKASSNLILRLPRKVEIETYDGEAQSHFGSSLHHFVWTLLNYKNFAHFKCTLFDMLPPTLSASGPETLNKLDIQAFLYCAALTCNKQKSSEPSFLANEKPIILPANITELLCPLSQLKWWDCAYKFSQNGLGTELTDIRVTLTRGIEVVRCIDHHGLDAELLCILGRIFSEKSKDSTNIGDKKHLVLRAALYYMSAIPILEKLKNKMVVKIPEKRMFDYTHKDLSSKDINLLIDESKLYVAKCYFNDEEYDKVVEILSSSKSPQAYFYLSQTYMKLAIDDGIITKDSSPDEISKHITLLSHAKKYVYKALDRLKEVEESKSNPLYIEIQDLIEDIETNLNNVDQNISGTIFNDGDDKYFSDDNFSANHETIRSNRRIIRNISSTPKASSNTNISSYRTAVDTHILENTRMDQQYLEKIENEIKNLHKRDSNINEFMEQTKFWFEENRKLGNQIMSTINTNIQNTTDQFKLLKISVDHVKDQINECRSECKDVGELKKQITELKKEMNKLKKSSSEPTANENDKYNLDADYRSSDGTANFSSQMPFAPSQVVPPPFNQRLIPPYPAPPNPYSLYSQTLYNLYNQYSLFSQPTSAPGTTPMFDPSRTQVNYPGVYPTPEQIYLDMVHPIPQNVPAAPIIPNVPVVPTMPPVPTKPTIPAMPVVSAPTTCVITSKVISKDTKEISQSLPVNVVITSSDPLPTTTVTQAPVLSVTIPSKHIKGTPHNYQIPMPSSSETKVVAPPVFNFSFHGNKTNTTTSTSSTWNAPSIQSNFKPQTNTETSLFNDSLLNKSLDNSKSVVDGIYTQSSPNASINKSRTISEKSNTSVENYDPCPDFKPIVPLPAEVKVKTGEEDETVIFCARAKLFRFVDKQWKERGLGEMKLLKHKISGKVRVLMRREQIHKVCANHIISSEMEIKPMMNETKAYFWVANDFADENMVLEKFCIRFKTADIAQEFYNTFEKARQESATTPKKEVNITNVDITTEGMDKTSTPAEDNKVVEINSASLPQGKAVVGGFTFSSTPSFKPVSVNKESDAKPLEEIVTKTNIFGGLTFKTKPSAPFNNNIFSVTSTDVSSPISTTEKNVSNKINVSDTVEDFEPSIDFKPVVPLPDLIDQKTGEEDENVLFEHRAKLLRFDTTTKEWKERGLGNIKLLIHKDNINKVRLLMRREQIMKVCCNHAVTKEMVFQKMPNIDKAVTWCAKDFSEGELVAETFCLRFKTVQICNDFVAAIKSAQSKIKDESKAAKEEQNAAKQNIQAINIKSTTGWGDSFKPKPGSWECQNCLVRNEANVEKCNACNNSKDSALENPINITTTQTTTKFNFGIPSQTPGKVEQNKELLTSAISTWGDEFKPKEGTWECNCCFVRNQSNLENCSACNNPKDPNAIKTETKSIFDTNASTVKFRFGLPPAPSNQPADFSSSIFDGTGTHKFYFGVPKNISDNLQQCDTSRDQGSIINTNNVGPINFSLKNNTETCKTNVQVKVPLLPNPQTDNAFKQPGGKENETFGFKFTPKLPVDTTIFEKTSKGSNEDRDGDKYATEHSTCVAKIPLPSKGMFVPGEENETVLYSENAKLFRFVDGEWKKRGIGNVKILKHNDTGKLRVIMKNDETSKICLNHTLAPEITYTPKDDCTWLFAANDFSEGESSLQQFSLKFNNKDMTLQFKDTIDKAREGKLSTEMKVYNKFEKDTNDSGGEDVIFVNEIHATSEEKEKAKELMLPENFYTYKNKEPCQGCRGCDTDPELSHPPSNMEPREANSQSSNLSTPINTSHSSFQSPANSFYGTPSNYEKTFDNSLFRTPIGSIASSKQPVTPMLSELVIGIGNDNTSKENASISKSSLETETKSASAITSEDTKISTSTKSSVLAPPKLSTLNTMVTKEDTCTNPEKNSGFGNVKSIFGNTSLGSSTNTSIFNTSANKDIENQSAEGKSIFGGNNKNSTNLFANSSRGSFFSSTATSGYDSKTAAGIFGLGSQNMFGSDKSIFGNTLNQKLIPTPESKSNNLKSDGAPCSNNSNDKTESKEIKKDTTVLFDGNISFADLSSNVDSATFQKKADFQWEGAGQQLFKAAQQLNQSKNTSGAGDEASGAHTGDEEYDPHYEPIVPLPDKIVVTTGEEDEQKLFGERCKLYRYDDKTREWKERGVGEMKILYHPGRNTYRMLLRREQVHKAVLNMLIFSDLEMLPMMKSDRAWTWAGINYAENPAGVQETLAVRFKSTDLAERFHEQVIGAVKKLQVAAATAIAEEKEASNKQFVGAAPLRLPKHLEDNARADVALLATAEIATPPSEDTSVEAQGTETKTEIKPNGDVNEPSGVDMFKHVQFREPEKHDDQDEDEEHDEDDDEYDYEQNDYDQYYNEDEEDETGVFYSCEGEAVVTQGEDVTKCEHAQIMVAFDQDIYAPKILVTDATTGEIISDMVIHTETEFRMDGDSCSWTGRDFTSNDPVDKTVTVNFFDSETTVRFFDSCETSKAASYSSMDPES